MIDYLLAMLLTSSVIGDVPTRDMSRFPDPETVKVQLAWSTAHIEWLEARLEIDLVHPAYWQEWIDDAKSRRAPWEQLQQSRTDWYWQQTVWTEQRELFRLIGPDNWYNGTMPSIVPDVRRFASR